MSTSLEAPSAAVTRRGERVTLACAAFGTALVVAHGFGLLGPLDAATFVLFAVGGVAAAILGVRWYRPRVRWPLLLMSSALLVFLAGGVAREALNTLSNLTASRSLIPDLITIPGYGLLIAGAEGLGRVRNGDRTDDLDAVLDGVVAALAVLALAWVYLVQPTLFHAGVPLSVRLLLACYPPLSVFLFAVAARIALTPRKRRTPAYRYLLSAAGFMLIGDVVYMFVDVGIAHLPKNLVDVPYALAYVCIACLFLSPTMRELSEPVVLSETAPRRGRLAFVAVALGLPAFVTAVRRDSATGDRLVLASIILALTATAIWRLLRALSAHARSEAQLSYQATHDVLTGLPNRAAVGAEVQVMLSEAATHGTLLALLFLDIDRFKLVNDTLGHSHGDELLIAVAERLIRHVPGHLVARIGGDEFIVLVPRVADPAEALRFAESIRICLQDPFAVDGTEIFVSASIGVSLADGSTSEVDDETMIRDADTAMYRAKDAGRDAVAVFDNSMRDVVQERLAIERELRTALERGQLSLHYQPVIEMPGEEIEGFEALLRWTHPELGSIPPGTFIPVAEDSGLIVDIGTWVLQEACRQVAAWRHDLPGGQKLYVAVNLSALQLRDPSYVDTILGAMLDSGVPGDALCLELTESQLMGNPDATADLLSTLRRFQVKLSIDDFGTGYSSLAYLNRFPVDSVKIDRSFVMGLEDHDSPEQGLVAAIIAMANALGLTTIAEGAETVIQRDSLVSLGVSAIQGYFYSRPVPADRVPDLVRVRNAHDPVPVR